MADEKTIGFGAGCKKWVMAVETLTGKTGGEAVRGRGAKRGRGGGDERLSTLSFFFFLDAVLPAGAFFLTCWLEERGYKKL